MDLLLIIGLASMYLGIGIWVAVLLECETDGQSLIITLTWPVVLIMLATVVLLTLAWSAVETIGDFLGRKLGGK